MHSILGHKNGKIQNTNIFELIKKMGKYDKRNWTKNTELFF